MQGKQSALCLTKIVVAYFSVQLVPGRHVGLLKMAVDCVLILIILGVFRGILSSLDVDNG